MEKAKILIVEDEAIIAKDIQNSLNGFGYAPAIISSGEKAIKMADEIMPDLVLMDIILKGIDGIKAAGHIHDRFNIPIIYFSAYMDEERLQKTKGTEPFGYIFKPYEDNELRPSIEMALQRDKREKALRESEEFCSCLLNNSPNPMLVINLDTSVKYVNPALERLTGFSSAELIGCKAPYPWWTEETVQKTHNDLEKAMREGAQKLDELFQKKDGTRFWVEITSAPIMSDGEFKYYLANWMNITERKKREEESEAHREHIKLINKILRHDLINDLNVINSALRLYGRSKKEELLEEASAHVNKSVELINRMRELDLFISSHRGLKLYPVTDVLNEVIESYPAIAFNIEGEGQVLADESLNSVIDNIISNAVVHGKTDKIDIKIGERGEYCEIKIADYGVGIPEEIKAKIFEERFAYGETGGTGFGLHIVKKAMETYGGHVRVEENTPRGAVFVLILRKLR
ncbi:Signal transduction histidine kinase [Methanophagales archaeon]|nr:Signal transduction histidine kinase [Methanophagales archaeon]